LGLLFDQGEVCGRVLAAIYEGCAQTAQSSANYQQIHVLRAVHARSHRTRNEAGPARLVVIPWRAQAQGACGAQLD